MPQHFISHLSGKTLRALKKKYYYILCNKRDYNCSTILYALSYNSNLIESPYNSGSSKREIKVNINSIK